MSDSYKRLKLEMIDVHSNKTHTLNRKKTLHIAISFKCCVVVMVSGGVISQIVLIKEHT